MSKNLSAWLSRKAERREKDGVVSLVGDIQEESSVGDGSVDDGNEDGSGEEGEEGSGDNEDESGNDGDDEDESSEGDDDAEKVDSLVGEGEEGEEKHVSVEAIQPSLITKQVDLAHLKTILMEAVHRHLLEDRRRRSGDDAPINTKSGPDAEVPITVDATPPKESVETRRPDPRFWRKRGGKETETEAEKEKGKKMELCMERYREARRGVEAVEEEEVGDSGDDKERSAEYQMWCERWEEGLW
jgi:hypothetical protein